MSLKCVDVLLDKLTFLFSNHILSGDNYYMICIMLFRDGVMIWFSIYHKSRYTYEIESIEIRIKCEKYVRSVNSLNI